MEAYVEKLHSAANSAGNIICMGCDPVDADIPIAYETKTFIVNTVSGNEAALETKRDVARTLLEFYKSIIDAAVEKKKAPAALKPNYAFWAAFEDDGRSALRELIKYGTRQLDLPVILDAKRADIGKTSEAYCKEVFDDFGADAVTLHPYMGFDSLEPFIKRAENGKGLYILCRTSNKGAKDFQDLLVQTTDGPKPLYMAVAEKIIEWGKNAGGNVGAVVGATSPDELQQLATYFAKQEQSVPLLIPGVGSQGGSTGEVMSRLRKAAEARKRGFTLSIHRINNSSGINFAWKKNKDANYVGAALDELEKMAKEMDYQITDSDCEMR